MTQHEFVEVTSEIEGFFGKELDTYQRKIWYEEIKKLTKERYRQVARECYKNLKYMPKLADIIEINKNATSAVKRNTENEVCKCSRCNGTGIVLYTKIVDGYTYQYGARCNCTMGLQLSPKIPSIHEVGLNY